MHRRLQRITFAHLHVIFMGVSFVLCLFFFVSSIFSSVVFLLFYILFDFAEFRSRPRLCSERFRDLIFMISVFGSSHPRCRFTTDFAKSGEPKRAMNKKQLKKSMLVMCCDFGVWRSNLAPVYILLVLKPIFNSPRKNTLNICPQGSC